MKTIALILLSTVLLGAESSVFAAEVQQSSRSAGKLKLDQSIDLSAELKQRELVVKPAPTASENFAESAAAQRLAGIANRHDQLFEIYDADVQLTGDFDGDGFYHALNVYFDVDVNIGDATVYAKLYLSREGGPWSQYFTTDLFDIYGDEVADAYEVETELVDGYEPGYYAVLVEIYSLDHAYMVTSEVLDYYYLGRDVALEDIYWDEAEIDLYGEVTVSHHGAGSISTLLLFFLIIQVVIAARGALALTPCKNSEDNKKKGSPELRSFIYGR
jgi:hypothetical protein